MRDAHKMPAMYYVHVRDTQETDEIEIDSGRLVERGKRKRCARCPVLLWPDGACFMFIRFRSHVCGTGAMSFGVRKVGGYQTFSGSEVNALRTSLIRSVV